MDNKNHPSIIKEKFTNALITVYPFSFYITFFASLILLILYVCFIFSNYGTFIFEGNWIFAIGIFLSLETIISTATSTYYVLEYFSPLEKYIPIFILSAINITTFIISVVIFLNLCI